MSLFHLSLPVIKVKSGGPYFNHDRMLFLIKTGASWVYYHISFQKGLNPYLVS
jgi:hypothetical protein